MASDIIQIVDEVSATPTVLLDLNSAADESGPLGVSLFNAPPPQLVRSSSQTQSQDGSTDAGSVYGDRVIDMDIDHFTTTQDASADVLQTMARLLSDPRGQWLMYQPNGASAPVFFRLRRGDITQINDILAAAALRELHLTIPAEPFAYGLPVTGMATIANDPTAVTNPMSCVFTDVQGDVETPLQVWFPSDDVASARTVLLGTSQRQTEPYWFDLSSASAKAAGGNWSATSDPADAAAVGGTARRITRTGSGLEFAPNGVATINMDIAVGDYRIFLRSKSGQPFSVGFVPTSPYLEASSPVEAGASYGWTDLGVYRLPLGSPVVAQVPGLAPVLTGLFAGMTLSNAAADTIDLDGLLFVPAGLDLAPRSALTLIRSQGTGLCQNLIVDGINRAAFYANDDFYRTESGRPGPTVAGGLPSLVPGQDNILHVIRKVRPTTKDDPKTETFVLTFLYYPRYLYTRPATS